MKPLYLYGPPASGKTTTARQLSAAFGVPVLDLDAVIVGKIGMPIAQFFAERGEAAFRQIESETLREVSAPVVALGGGTLLDDANRAFAEHRGFVAVLDADDATIARRIEAAKGTRPLGNMLATRRAHYASFAHHVKSDTRILLPAHLRGPVAVPVSKSHLHRLLIAEFLAEAGGSREKGGWRAQEASCLLPSLGECEDIAATRRCLSALADAQGTCVLDCGESGSTLRFLAPVAAALGVKASFVRRGRLAERPMRDYAGLASGEHALPGDVSSQFVTGLLFALPLLAGDSRIVFTSPLQSRGYVDMTLDVLRTYNIRIEETADGFAVPGGQRYRAPRPACPPEGDWSGAAFWFAANALGADVAVTNLTDASRQPDRAVRRVAAAIAAGGAEVDVSGFPDLFPALCVVAAATAGETRFVNAARLRLKESDRIAAMEAVLAAFGVEMASTADTATVRGAAGAFAPCEIDSRNDHRIAMSAAVAATRADGPVLLHGAGCVAKSYPGFFDDFLRLAAPTAAGGR